MQSIDNAIAQAPPVSQQPVVYAVYTAFGSAPTAYSAQSPRTSDVRRSPNMNSAGLPSRYYDNSRQTADIKEEIATTTRVEITTKVIEIGETTDLIIEETADLIIEEILRRSKQCKTFRYQSIRGK